MVQTTASLKRVRANLKGSITRLLAYARGITEQSTETVDALKLRVTRATEAFNQFSEVEAQIFQLNEEEESQFIEVEENYLTILSDLNYWIRKRQVSDAVVIEPSMSETAFNGIPNASHGGDIKLPKCHIPSFAGDYMQWQSFIDLFTSAIHNKDYLTSAQKLQYLKSLLRGDAEVLLRHYQITDANYHHALAKLRSRYDRKRHTVNAFIRTFMEQPCIPSPPSANNIRKILDTSDEVLRGLSALGANAERRDPWLIYVVLNKLDTESKSLWAQKTTENDFPTMEEFLDFLRHRTDALESIRSASASIKKQFPSKASSSKAFNVSTAPTIIFCCPICKTNEHKLFECIKFKQLSVDDKRGLIRSEKRCFNCLNFNHSIYNCKARVRCMQCKRKHHTLLHKDEENIQQPQSYNNANQAVSMVTGQEGSSSSSSITFSTKVSTSKTQVILPTAVIHVLDCYGSEHTIRALLDSASQESFVTEECVQKLGIKRANARTVMTGLGDARVGQSRGKCALTFLSCAINSKLFSINAIIVPKITSLPSYDFMISDDQQFNKFPLADPQFNQRGPIDVLLGAEIYYEIIEDKKVKLSNELIAHKTQLGWTIAGRLSETAEVPKCFNILLDIDSTLRRFWEIESLPNSQIHTKEEQACEDNFSKTVIRASDGKFVVRLPFRSNPSCLGSNLGAAIARLKAMERRFHKDATFRELYMNFMNEYESLGHMEEIKPNFSVISKQYFLPHHGVLKESSSTTKLRVVFDASAASSNGKSLNQLLMVGPTIQDPLINIIIRFRQHKYVMSADIEKMYRQIWVNQQDAMVQNIVWRKNEADPIKYYRLKTLTYGTAPATFISTRCLKELAIRLEQQYPRAAEAIQHDFYVDDLMTGANSIEELGKLKSEIVSILDPVKFNLRKWLTNDSDLQAEFGAAADDNNIKKLWTTTEPLAKVLGLSWDAHKDVFSFRVYLTPREKHTKRTLLSEASRVFDPLGWVAPVVINIKILFQELWLHKLEWDDELPTEIATRWIMWRNDLPNLNQLHIPRWLGTQNDVELHGFCDASKWAYAAAVYARVVSLGNTAETYLVASKTKVAPIKQISIPRLELMGAQLLTKLVEQIQAALRLKITRIVLWTDSTIVLDWLSEHPRRWPTFVANRTSDILSKFGREHWRHVSTKHNPADCASRGLAANELMNNAMWWIGPNFLNNSEENWPIQKLHYGTKEELKSESSVFKVTIENDLLHEITQKFSSYFKMKKNLALVLRFIKNCKMARNNKSSLNKTSISPLELEEASNIIMNYVQSTHFHEEYLALSSGNPVDNTSSIKALNPILFDNVIRVGGRINKSDEPFNSKHPIILPQSSAVTKAIILDCHDKYFHPGVSLTLSLLRQNFWIVRAKHSVRHIINSCVRCIRQRPKPNQQLMGDLPKARTEYNYPFQNTGVDYAGPFKVHAFRRRGQRPMKVYLCIFVCFGTKAVHIECVCDLSTESFIGALKRFTARRGLVSSIFSDNGTNFVGANRQLVELYRFLKENTNVFASFLLKDNIQWHFNPPASPHMGGLVEAAVKSAKSHLKKVIGETILTLEEFSTLTTQIEGVLNSRPICGIISASDDYEIITPGHFLIGRSLTQVPEHNMDVKLSSSQRWKMVKQLNQHFWKRWHRDYLTTLQSRSKWKNKGENLKINDIVLLREENVPATHWPLAKIVRIHAGTDNLVRVVSIKLGDNIFRRPVTKLVKLPLHDQDHF